MRFDFWKMHGTGNDFVVVNNFKLQFPSWSPELVKEICDRHTGAGADGLLLLEPSSLADFKMRYFNADGFESSMCANGSRCISYFAFKNGIIPMQARFEAGDGVHAVQIENQERIRVEVRVRRLEELRTFPVDFSLPETINFKGFINTGVPHLVLEVKGLQSVPVQETGRALRYHPYYQPEGTNIDFVETNQQSGSLRLNVRTYERGVEAETLSCGSGVTAAAFLYLNNSGLKLKELEVDTRGGKLKVILSPDDDRIYLQGPVQIIYQGKYLKEGGS
jgi:diaminopimelate epimerase